MRSLGIFLLLVGFGSACAQNPAALIGIDHIPLAVRDLDRATASFKQLGFAIKPGRAHDNGIRNNHIKFIDGSGLELIASAKRADQLSTLYVDHLRHGDGPAFVSFHARDTAKLIAALSAARIDFDQSDGTLTFKDPKLNFLFIVADNRSATDRPEHFAHSNGAFAMGEVWIAMDDPTPLQGLLAALGAPAMRAMVKTPEPNEAIVFDLQNGRVVILPARYQLVTGRPVIGVAMSVRELGGQRNSAFAPGVASTSMSLARIIAPERAHGLWLAFRRGQ
jgi:hypothetical protein